MSERFDEMNPDPELVPLVSSLKGLTPAGTSLSRDRLLFEAGRSSVLPRLAWLWPACSGAFALLSLALVGFIAFADRPVQTVVVERERLVEVRVPVPMEKPVEPSPAPNLNQVKHEDEGLSRETIQMFQLRRDVLRWGVAMLPPNKPAPKVLLAGRDPESDLERWLDVPPGTLTTPYTKTPRLFPQIKGDD